MTKTILFTTVSLFLASSSYAQSSSSVSLPSDKGAATSEMKLDEEPETDFSNLKARIVPQVGMTSMGYSGSLKGDEGQGFSGGITTELGETKARLLETGVLFLQNRSTHADTTINTSEIGLPLMGKLRFINAKSQQWYFKVGALTTFQTGSQPDHTSSMDVLASLGVGARLPIDRRMDFVIEATYNRGVLSAFFQDNSAQEGVLVFSGLSIGL